MVSKGPRTLAEPGARVPARRAEERHRLEGKAMGTKIFVNLPVKDLKQSIGFFNSLGYTFNPQFTDETAACMIVSDDIYVMLLTRAKFKEFTPKAICDATKSTEVLVCVSCESRDRLDDLVGKGLAAGGTTHAEAKDYGFMYQHGFQDPDGHIWELIYMEPAALTHQNDDRTVIASQGR
jgi:predicted lactoylglutathione lyase